MIRTTARTLALTILSLALAACGGDAGDAEKNLDSLDAELVEGQGANAADPAVMGALQDQIMVDPNLTAQANGEAVRPPSRPHSGGVPQPAVAAGGVARLDGEKLLQVPAPTPAAQCSQCKAARESMTLGALAARQKDGRTRGCAAKLDYSAAWAQRLPRDMPLFPNARVIEAAGSDGGSCALRVVSFWTAAPMERMLDWYYTRAIRGGYTAEHQSDGAQHILGGTRARDEGAYVLFMIPRDGGGTMIDLIANNGV